MTRIPENNRLHAGAAIRRREFVRRSTAAFAAATATGFPLIRTSRAEPEESIGVGVIGCGGRGTGAALNVLRAATKVVYPKSGYHTEDAAERASTAAKNVKIVALADVFRDRLEGCRAQLRKVGVEVAEDRCFHGFEGYRSLLAVPEVQYVLLTTPPYFRPLHLRAAVEAGKHVFMEKPVAVDGPGVRSVLESGEIAGRKGLGIAAGTQRRHQPSYIETVKRIRDGAVGEIVECRAYWNGGTIWVVDRQPGWSDMEWQLRNWNYFTWLSGDHIVEQHVHNLDVIHWVVGEHPVKANGMGGRQARGGREHGHIYDHFAVEFEYANGMRLFSQCRQIDGCSNIVGEAVVGSRGWSNCKDYIQGAEEWRYEGPPANPYEQEHLNLLASIRSGKPLNESRAIAESTLMGIMGRISSYTGQTVTWDQVLNSRQDLSPPRFEFGPLPFPEVPIPGKYRFS